MPPETEPATLRIEFKQSDQELDEDAQKAAEGEIFDDIQKELNAHRADIFPNAGREMSIDKINTLLQGKFLINKKEFNESQNFQQPEQNNYRIYYKKSDNTIKKVAEAKYTETVVEGTRILEPDEQSELFKVIVDEIFEKVKTWLIKNRKEILESQIQRSSSDADEVTKLTEELNNVEVNAEAMRVAISDEYREKFISYKIDLSLEQEQKIEDLLADMKQQGVIEYGTLEVYERDVNEYLRFIRGQLQRPDLVPATRAKYLQYERELSGSLNALKKKFLQEMNSQVSEKRQELGVPIFEGPLLAAQITRTLQRVEEQMQQNTEAGNTVEVEKLQQTKDYLLQLQENLSKQVQNEALQYSEEHIRKRIEETRTRMLKTSVSKSQLEDIEDAIIYYSNQISEQVAQQTVDTMTAAQPNVKTSLQQTANLLESLGEEVALRKQLLEKQNQIDDVQAEIDVKSAKRKNVSDGQQRRWNAQMTQLIAEKNKIVQQLKGYATLPGGDVLTTEVVGTTTVPAPSSETTNNKNNQPETKNQEKEMPSEYEVEVEVGGKKHRVTTPEELERLYEGILNQNQVVNLKDFANTGMNMTTLRSKNLTQQEINFVVAYKKLVYNKHNKDRATILNKLVRKRGKFDDKNIGTISDFRRMAKRIKAEYKEEKKKHKYAREAFAYMVAYSYLEAGNKIALLEIEHLAANGMSMPNMQERPTFRKDGQIDIRTSAPYNLAEVGYELFGDKWQDELKDLMGKNFEGLFPAGFNFLPPKYVFPSEAPPTSVSQRKSNNSSYLQELNAEGEVVPSVRNMPDAALFNQFWYLYTARSPEVNNFELSATASFGREVIRRWLTKAPEFDLMGAIMAKGKTQQETLEEVNKIMKYSITPGVAQEVRRWYMMNVKGNEQITDDKKYRLYSQGFVRGLLREYGEGTPDHMMARLGTLYGGSRDNELSTVQGRSSKVVGMNVARLVDEVMGGQYLSAPRGPNDLNPVRNGYRPGANRVIEDFSAVIVQKANLDPKYAKVIAGAAKLGLTVGAVVAAWHFGKRVLGLNAGHKSGRTGRLLKIGGTIAVSSVLFPVLFNKSGTEMVSGFFNGMKLTPEGGLLANWLNLSKQPEGLTKKQKLNFIFGNLTINKLFEYVHKDASGNFALKPGALRKIMEGAGLDPSQKADLESMNASLGGGGIDAIINGGLVDAGITPANRQEMKQQYGNLTLSEYIERQALATSYREDLNDAIGEEVEDSFFTELEEHAMTLSTEEERLLFGERLEKAKALMATTKKSKVYIYDHLLKYRKDLMQQIGRTPEQLELLKMGFEKEESYTQLIKDFVIGTSPFDGSSSTEQKYEVLLTKLEELFSTGTPNELFKKYVLDPNAVLNLKLNDEDDKVKLNIEERNRYVNRPGAQPDGTPLESHRQYTEGLFAMGGKEVFMGVEKPEDGTAIEGTNLTQSHLVVRVPTGDGQREQWRVQTVAEIPFFVESFGRRKQGGNDQFVYKTFDAATASYTDSIKFSSDFLSSIINAASQGDEAFTIGATDLQNPEDETGSNVKIMRTGKKRPE